MAIWFCGDAHGRFNRLNDLVLRHRPHAIVLLGDLDLERPLEAELAPVISAGATEIWFIPGNHDTDSEQNYQCLFESALAHRSLHARIGNVAGLRVAGLGGVFREKIWWPPAEPAFSSYEEFRQDLVSRRPYRERTSVPDAVLTSRERTHHSSIFYDDYVKLACEPGGAEVLVTHEAPASHPKGFAALGELAQCLGARFHFHGHHHEDLVYAPVGGVRGYAVGKRGIMSLKDGVVETVLPGEE